MASAKTRRRSTRKRTPEEPQRDGLPWPMLREQQALQARWGAAEQAAAAKRAQVLVSQGYGPLIEWLQHPGQPPGEGTADAADLPQPAAQRCSLADLFKAA